MFDAGELSAAFFGPGNDLDLDNMPPSDSELVKYQLAELDEGRYSWVVLPRRRGPSLGWYGIAYNADAERQMREMLQAFVGPSFGKVPPSRRDLRHEDVLERALAGLGVRYVVLVRSVGDAAALNFAIDMLIQSRRMAPPVVSRLFRPAGLIIRDFELALSRNDADASERFLAELAATGALRSENYRYLVFARLAQLGRWKELASHEWFDTMATARRPRQVTEMMLEAVWRTYFGDLVGDVGDVRHEFSQQSIGDRYRALLNTLESPSNPAARRLMVLDAVMQDDRERALGLIATADPDEASFLRRLVEPSALPSAPVHAPEVRLEDVRGAFQDGRWELVVELSEQSDHTAGIVELAVRAAVRDSDPDLIRRVLVLVDGLDADARSRIDGDELYGPAIEMLRSRMEVQCGNWVEWFERIGSEPWPQAPEAARIGLDRWDRAFLDNQSTAEAAASALVSAPMDNDEVVQTSLGALARLLAEETSRRHADALRLAVLALLAPEANANRMAREVVGDLLIAVLESDLDPSDYEEVVKALITVWQGSRAYEAFAWALDTVDFLVASPSPRPDLRNNFLATLVKDASDLFDRRLQPHERRLLRDLLQECELAHVISQHLPLFEMPSDTDTEVVWDRLSGKVVGLYSLLAGAATRFRDRLTGLNPEVEVRLNEDHRATNRLRSLVLSAHYMIVDTAHAKHAATGAIDAVLSRSEQILPVGSGVASFLAALASRLEEERTPV